jgi:hypothetical protein
MTIPVQKRLPLSSYAALLDAAIGQGLSWCWCWISHLAHISSARAVMEDAGTSYAIVSLVRPVGPTQFERTKVLRDYILSSPIPIKGDARPYKHQQTEV